MKLQGHTNSLTTNVEAESQEFSVGDSQKIISILRDKLYEDKIGSVCREIISNARDAMREVGKDNSFEITVPNSLNPVFRVRDFGPGISPDRMKNVFLLYGNSTKNNTNNQTGGWGLGAKTPFAYNDSFSIVTWIDGIKRSYIAHTGSNNNGRLDLVSTTNTDEPCGTEIQVAVKSIDIREFRNAIHRAIYFWQVRPTLKGELNPPVLVTGYRVGDIEVIDHADTPDCAKIHHYSKEMMAVIDGVAYPIAEKLISKIPNLLKLKELVNREVILHMGNGVVEVSASRESIADSKHTLDALNRIAGKACLEVTTHIKDAFAKVTDTASYLKTYIDLSANFVVDEFARFGDYAITDGFIESSLLKNVKMQRISCLNHRKRRISKVSKSELSEAKKKIHITNLNSLFYADTEESVVKQNKRIREYLKTKNELIIIAPLLNIEYDTVVEKDGTTSQVIKSKILDTATFEQVVKDLGVKDFQSITYVEEPRKKGKERDVVTRQTEEFCYHRLGYGRHHYTSLAKNTQKWLYFPLVGGGWGDYNSHDLLELSKYLGHQNLSICGIGVRAAKMVAGDANYTLLTDWLANYKPSDADILIAKAVICKNNDYAETLSKVKGIRDKFVIDIVEQYRAIFKRKNSELPKLLAKKLAGLKELKDFEADDKKFGELIDSKYPLVKDLQYCRVWEELAFYMNIKHKGNK